MLSVSFFLANFKYYMTIFKLRLNASFLFGSLLGFGLPPGFGVKDGYYSIYKN